MRKLALVLVLAAAPAFAQQQKGSDGRFMNYFLKDTSCGTYVAQAKNENYNEIVYFWFRGFVSGANFAKPQDQLMAPSLPSEDTFRLYMEKFCRENPLDPIVGGMLKLHRELKGQQ